MFVLCFKFWNCVSIGDIYTDSLVIGNSAFEYFIEPGIVSRRRLLDLAQRQQPFFPIIIFEWIFIVKLSLWMLNIHELGFVRIQTVNWKFLKAFTSYLESWQSTFYQSHIWKYLLYCYNYNNTFKIKQWG